MSNQVDDQIKELISEKVKAQISVIMRDDEVEELVIEQISAYQTEGSSERLKLKQWIKEELDKRVKQMVINEVLDPIYTGTLHGDPGQFYRDLIRENAAELVGAMFANVLDQAKSYAVNQLTTQINNNRSY